MGGQDGQHHSHRDEVTHRSSFICLPLLPLFSFRVLSFTFASFLSLSSKVLFFLTVPVTVANLTVDLYSFIVHSVLLLYSLSSGPFPLFIATFSLWSFLFFHFLVLHSHLCLFSFSFQTCSHFSAPFSFSFSYLQSRFPSYSFLLSALLFLSLSSLFSLRLLMFILPLSVPLPSLSLNHTQPLKIFHPFITF